MHEVAVGPVHAGIIEPGHFRFQCHGEQVFHLEIVLGYQHRGVERLLAGGPDRAHARARRDDRRRHRVGHGLAYVQALEALAGAPAAAARDGAPRRRARARAAREPRRRPRRARGRRRLPADRLVLRRAARRVPERARPSSAATASAAACSRRAASASTSRADAAARARRASCAARGREARRAAGLLLRARRRSRARLEGTGVVSRETARRARARRPGRARERRRPRRAARSPVRHLPLRPRPGRHRGHGRRPRARARSARSRSERSVAFVREQLDSLPGGRGARAVPGRSRPRSSSSRSSRAGAARSAHVAVTDERRRASPATRWWTPRSTTGLGLAMALRDEQISDFPLCNKSFNLSYCGHDL